MRALLPALLAALLLAAGPVLAGSQYLDLTRLRVIDGDTVVHRGHAIRVVGLQAPELRAACLAEVQLAKQARDRAAAMVAAAKTVRAVYQYRHRRDGSVVRATDRYGRYLARLYVDRADWAELLIAAGLAKPWNGTGPRPGFC